jgi:transposase
MEPARRRRSEHYPIAVRLQAVRLFESGMPRHPEPIWCQRHQPTRLAACLRQGQLPSLCLLPASRRPSATRWPSSCSTGDSPLGQAAQRLAAPSAPADTGTRANGQRHDAPQALPLRGELAPAYLLADRGAPFVAALAARGAVAVIAPQRKRRHPRAYDAARYAQRHPVERLFSHLKQFAAWRPGAISWMPFLGLYPLGRNHPLAAWLLTLPSYSAT